MYQQAGVLLMMICWIYIVIDMKNQADCDIYQRDILNGQRVLSRFRELSTLPGKFLTDNRLC